MKAAASRKALAVLLGAGTLGTALPAAAQRVKIDRCTPTMIRAGEPVEITLAGPGLENAELWTSFAAEIERTDEKSPRFRITTDYIGPGAIRAHSNEGVSNLCYLTVQDGERVVTPCGKRTRREDAQVLQPPCTVEGSSPALAANYYRFTAKGGEPIRAEARSRGSGFDGVITIRAAESGKRLVMVDDSEATGADPVLEFIPPSDGDFILELIDSQYRGGLSFELSLSTGEPVPTLDGVATVLHVEERASDPLPISREETIYGVFDAKGDIDVFRFDAPTRTFLTIAPSGRSISSGATPHLTLANADGAILAKTPHDSFDEQPIRIWLAPGDGYLLSARDAFDRHGTKYLYRIAVTARRAPFDLTIPGQRDKKHPLHDKFLAVPGGVFTVPVHCGRHGFGAAIQLSVESPAGFVSENGGIAGKQGNVDLRVRVPQGLKPGTLEHVWVSGTATADGTTHEGALRTRAVLEERDGGAPIPNEVDGKLAVRIIESPLTVEITPSAEIARGSSMNIPVVLAWHDEKRKFNTALVITGLPKGAHTSEKKLNNKDTTTTLELKLDQEFDGELKKLRVQARLDYHKQSLFVESEAFAVTIKKIDEEKK